MAKTKKKALGQGTGGGLASTLEALTAGPGAAEDVAPPADRVRMTYRCPADLAERLRRLVAHTPPTRQDVLTEALRRELARREAAYRKEFGRDVPEV